MSIPRIALLIMVTALLAACGKKGALYLPDAPPAPPAQEQPQSK